jgi:hypothetical protein
MELVKAQKIIIELNPTGGYRARLVVLNDQGAESNSLMMAYAPTLADLIETLHYGSSRF